MKEETPAEFFERKKNKECGFNHLRRMRKEQEKKEVSDDDEEISEEDLSRMFMTGRCGYSQAKEDMKLMEEGKLKGFPK